MQDLEVKRMQMFIKVTEFFTTYGAFFQFPIAKELFAAVENIVKELNAHAIAQIGGTKTIRENSSAKASLRSQLREDMTAISRMARAIAMVNPVFGDKFPMPPYGSDQLLLTAAESFVVYATPVADEFVNREMPADFLKQLQTNIELLKNAVSEKVQGNYVQMAASASIDDAIERGMKAVRQLDPIVRVKFEDNPAALVNWLNASRTERLPRSSAPPAPSPTPNQ